MVFGIGSGTGDEKSGAASAKPGGRLAQASGLGSGFLDAKAPNIDQPESKNEKTKLVNRAGESKSPYVSIFLGIYITELRVDKLHLWTWVAAVVYRRLILSYRSVGI